MHAHWPAVALDAILSRCLDRGKTVPVSSRCAKSEQLQDLLAISTLCMSNNKAHAEEMQQVEVAYSPLFIPPHNLTTPLPVMALLCHLLLQPGPAKITSQCWLPRCWQSRPTRQLLSSQGTQTCE
eukprot:124003-Chlamydomonas_euryale.AAC.14